MVLYLKGASSGFSYKLPTGHKKELMTNEPLRAGENYNDT